MVTWKYVLNCDLVYVGYGTKMSNLSVSREVVHIWLTDFSYTIGRVGRGAGCLVIDR